jgi:hypothetical protein
MPALACDLARPAGAAAAWTADPATAAAAATHIPTTITLRCIAPPSEPYQANNAS